METSACEMENFAPGEDMIDLDYQGPIFPDEPQAKTKYTQKLTLKRNGQSMKGKYLEKCGIFLWRFIRIIFSVHDEPKGRPVLAFSHFNLNMQEQVRKSYPSNDRQPGHFVKVGLRAHLIPDDYYSSSGFKHHPSTSDDKVIKGATFSLLDAINVALKTHEFLQYPIQDGGCIPEETPEQLQEALQEPVVEQVIEPVPTIVEQVIKPVQPAEPVVEQVIKPVPTIVQPAERVVEQVIKPVQPAEPVVEQVIKPVQPAEPVVEQVIKPVPTIVQPAEPPVAKRGREPPVTKRTDQAEIAELVQEWMQCNRSVVTDSPSPEHKKAKKLKFPVSDEKPKGLNWAFSRLPRSTIEAEDSALYQRIVNLRDIMSSHAFNDPVIRMRTLDPENRCPFCIDEFFTGKLRNMRPVVCETFAKCSDHKHLKTEHCECGKEWRLCTTCKDIRAGHGVCVACSTQKKLNGKYNCKCWK